MYIESSRIPALCARYAVIRSRAASWLGRLMMWYPNGVSTTPLTPPGARVQPALSNAVTNFPLGLGGRNPRSALLPGSSESWEARLPKSEPPLTFASALLAFRRAAFRTSGTALGSTRNRMCCSRRTSLALYTLSAAPGEKLERRAIRVSCQ